MHWSSCCSISVNRFNFGCRLFVTKVVSKLLPAIKNDLVDWQVETRIKASILSVVLLEHLEETSVVMQYADSLMELMLIGARDEEEEVVKNVTKSSLENQKFKMSHFCFGILCF